VTGLLNIKCSCGAETELLVEILEEAERPSDYFYSVTASWREKMPSATEIDDVFEAMDRWEPVYDGHDTEFKGKSMKGHTLYWHPKLPEEAYKCWLNLCRISKDTGWFSPSITLVWRK